MALRVPSGDTNQAVSFNWTPGLALASFQVWRSRNGASAVLMTTPTISEDASLAGQYHLVFDEDMDITAGNVTEQMLYTILHTDAPGQKREFEVELFVPSPIRKNVAFPNFVFEMVAAADNGTPLAGLTVTATRKLDGGAFAACANAVSEIGDGLYAISLAAADLNGSVVTLKCTASDARQTSITLIPAAA